MLGSSCPASVLASSGHSQWDSDRRRGCAVGRFRHMGTAAAYLNEKEVGGCPANAHVDRAEVFAKTRIWIIHEHLRDCSQR